MRNPLPNRSCAREKTRRSPAIPPLLLLMATVMASCSPSPGSADRSIARTAAVPTTVVSGPRVVFPSGTSVTVEVARTDQEKSQGLMFRESMPQEAGMVFLFEGLEIRPFWMKDCHFPLDMIYTRKDGTIVDVLKDVPPCRADPCPSYPPKGKADTVVEVNAGFAAKNGALPGARLVYREIPER
ncbi:MAG: DUF192 domain-containing protein [Thermoanaerobaculia bacterium]